MKIDYKISQFILLILPIILVFLLFARNAYSQQETIPVPLSVDDYEERIENYDSIIQVNKDGTLDVTEVIKVNALGQEIKRGIFRDFPTKYESNGIKFNVDFEIKEVLKDGRPEDYHTEEVSNGTRIYIGKSDVFLDPGFYTYTISYKTTRQLGFFDDHDELYYNVIGTGWPFKVSNGTAIVKLPEGVNTEDVDLEAYLGQQGSFGKSYVSDVKEVEGNTYALFKTTQFLNPSEGMSIVVGWPKGFVYEPTQKDKLAYFIKDNIMLFIALLLLLGTLIYYVIVWALYGNDPDDRVIIPEFDPPQGLSPAAIRYINKMEFDNKCLTALLVESAIKGKIRIEEKSKSFTIESIDQNYEKLFDEEVLMLTEFFENDKKFFTIGPGNHVNVQRAIKDIKGNLEAKYNNTYFKKNWHFLIPPILIMGLFYLGLSFKTPEVFTGIIPLVFIFSAISGGNNLIRQVKSKSSAKFASGPKDTFLFLVSLLAFIPIMFFGLIAFIFSVSIIGFWFTVVFALLTIIHTLFNKFMRVRTKLGIEAHDHIQGLKMFLTTTEKLRYESLINKETPNSLAIYEKYLPYAIALDVEPIWSKRFQSDIEGLANYTEGSNSNMTGLAWFVGSNDFSYDSFANSISSSINDVISASSVPPGSSSGFSGGGGGFSGGGGSGGGGGGGGGGGW